MPVTLARDVNDTKIEVANRLDTQRGETWQEMPIRLFGEDALACRLKLVG